MAPPRITRAVRSRVYPARLAAKSIPAAKQGFHDARGLPVADLPPRASDPGVLESYFDGVAVGPGLWKWRHYFPIYERYLERFVGTDVHMVEVGVFSGGSLPMWRSYLGANSQIIGVDIEPACRAYEGDQIQIEIGDQADPAFWAGFRDRHPRVDVLLDDGGHQAHQQIATLQGMLPHLSPGGVYICEDLHGAFQPFLSYVDGLSRPLHEPDAGPQPIHQHIAAVHTHPMVTVIEKPAHQPRPFEAPRHGSVWEPFL